MEPSTVETTGPLPDAGVLQGGLERFPAAGATRGAWWQRLPAAPMALTALFLCFLLVPPVMHDTRLRWAFVGVAGGLFIWELILWALAARQGRLLQIEFFPVKSHYVQACVQFSIMLYWGLYWPNVYPELPLILSQVVFLYALDALLSWSRGRNWRLGFGPLPIVISTNLLLWFKHDLYVFQFLMLTTGALAKQFVTWNRDGKRTHIFNPSAFGQSLFAMVLILTGTTNDYTWGKQIAASFDTPYMLVVIFLGGLVVQYFFQVTLMTAAATATLVLVNLVYTQVTDVYFFVSINVAAPIFLGVHLLLTDPATSPRTNVGKVIFGVLYGLGYAILFRAFDLLEVPLFWDKLLPVPVLNLCVPLIDRFTRSGFVGRLNGCWERALPPRKLNLVHMSCWAALFITMLATRYIEAPHPGDSVLFWKQAFADGKPHAGHSLVMAAGGQAEGANSGAAYNELGLICIEGKIVNENHATAAKYFAKACELQDESGCVNVAIQHLFLGERRSDEDVLRALDSLEKDCAAGGNSRSCFLIGFAYEIGRGRLKDTQKAIEYYEHAGPGNIYAVKGLARMALAGLLPMYDAKPLVQALALAGQAGDPESCWYLAYMYRDGVWLERNEEKARWFLKRSCALGYNRACEAVNRIELPPYKTPTRFVPGWATAFPLPQQ